MVSEDQTGDATRASMPSSPVFVRQMRADDLYQVQQLTAQLGYRVTTSELEERFSGILGSSVDCLLVGCGQNESSVMGWVHVSGYRTFTSPPFAEILALVVSEPFRRRGIGRQLVDSAECWASANDYSHVRLRSGMQRADEAHAFYSRLGYEGTKVSMLFRKELRARSNDEAEPL